LRNSRITLYVAVPAAAGLGIWAGWRISR
jgi:hypothetical protein